MSDDFDTAAAAALIQRTTAATRRSLTTRSPLLYGGWGVAWLLGLGAMWLSVRGQVPYQGPSAGAAILFGALTIGALIITIGTVIRATRGVHGQSETQGKIFGVSWGIGFGLFYILVGAMGRRGASLPVLGLVGAVGPLLVTALIYLVGAAIWLDRAMFAMGLWLAVVGAIGAWTGPVTVLLVNAVAGGGGFLVAAACLLWRGRR